LFESFWHVPDRRRAPAAAYDSLVHILHQYLDIIGSEAREPDVWERRALNHVLNDLDASQGFLAFSDMRVAITPPDNQSPDYPISAEDTAAVASLDLDYFRRCVDHLANRGYQPRS